MFYQHSSRKRRILIGSANEGGIGLAEARRIAREKRDVALGGNDPAAALRAQRPRTFAELIERYAASAEALRKRTWHDERRMLEKDALPILGKLNVDRVRKADVLGVVEGIAERGSLRVADRVARAISAIYNWAADESLVEFNPATRIRRRAASKARERVLAKGDLRALLTRLPEVYPDRRMQLMVRLILLTGCRKLEVQGARLSEFEFTSEGGPVWSIPGDRTKNGRRHVLPLTATALAVINEAMGEREALVKAGKVHSDTPLLFPASLIAGKRPDSNGMSDPTVLNRGLARAFKAGKVRQYGGSRGSHSVRREPLLAPERPGTGTWTIHDLRRAAASQLRELGVSADTRKAILNHAPTGVTEVHYDKSADMLPLMRAALEAWAQRLNSIAAGEYKIGQSPYSGA